MRQKKKENKGLKRQEIFYTGKCDTETDKTLQSYQPVRPFRDPYEHSKTEQENRCRVAFSITQPVERE